jgi:hypothetical protein
VGVAAGCPGAAEAQAEILENEGSNLRQRLDALKALCALRPGIGPLAEALSRRLVLWYMSRTTQACGWTGWPRLTVYPLSASCAASEASCLTHGS